MTVAAQDTVTQLVAAIRRVARVVPGAAEVAAAVCRPDYSRPGKPEIDREARRTRKCKSRRRDGFCGHVAAEPDTGLITDCERTMVTGPGSTAAENSVKMASRDRFRSAPAAAAGGPPAGDTAAEPQEQASDERTSAARRCRRGPGRGRGRRGAAGAGRAAGRRR
jgi:hypothetical protein